MDLKELETDLAFRILENDYGNERFATEFLHHYYKRLSNPTTPIIKYLHAPRQSGKTTFLKQIHADSSFNSLFVHPNTMMKDYCGCRDDKHSVVISNIERLRGCNWGSPYNVVLLDEFEFMPEHSIDMLIHTLLNAGLCTNNVTMFALSTPC